MGRENSDTSTVKDVCGGGKAEHARGKGELGLHSRKTYTSRLSEDSETMEQTDNGIESASA